MPVEPKLSEPPQLSHFIMKLANLHARAVVFGFTFATALLLANMTVAQTTALPSTQPGPFTLLRPGNFSLTVLGGAFISTHFGVTEQGLQAEQSITQSIGLVGRATVYQLYLGDHLYNPLKNPSTGHNHDYNYVRLQGGLDFRLGENSYFSILGGGDVADSNSASVEGDFSTWLLPHRQHPVNLAFSSIYTTENGVVANEIDLRAIVYSTETYALMAGAGGAFYASGFVEDVDGHGGPILSLFLSKWRAGVDIQAGYGSDDEFGEITIYKQFRWTE
jgi:hypothetical protein